MAHDHRASTSAPRFLVVASAALTAALAAAPAPRASAAGSVAWRLSTPGVYTDFEPVIGPDGTIYTGNGGAVTAVAPDGTVRWSVPATARQGEVAVGADGAIYAVTGTTSIVALDPADGSALWTFDGGDGIVGGPDVGPDGNVYAVADTEFGGIGLFSLTPQGALRWSEVGDPALSEQSGLGHRLEFAEDRVFALMTPGPTGGAPYTWAFDLDGNQQYVLGSGCEGQAVPGPLGRMVTGNGNCQRIRAYDAADGSLVINEPAPSQSPCSGLANVAVGPDGAMYTAFCYRAFWSVNADGSQRWFEDDFGFYFWMDHLAVVPDNSALLDLGHTSSAQGRIRAFSTADGTLLWQIDLPSEGGQSIASVTLPVFDMERHRAYFNARLGVTGSFLYAIDLGGPASTPGDANGDGVVNFADVLAALAAWGPCAGACPEDVNGDGTVSFADVLMILANWS